MSRYRSRMGNDRKARREIGRRLRKGGVMMCMMITSAMLLSACSGGNSSSKNTTAAQTTEAAAEGGVQDSQNEVMGRVKLVSDTEITVEQGPGGAPGQNSDGQQPGGAPGQDGDSQVERQTARTSHHRGEFQREKASHPRVKPQLIRSQHPQPSLMQMVH